MINIRSSNFWIWIMLFFAVSLYLLSDILLPFVVGVLVAYFLDPVADMLERRKISRGLASIAILSFFFVVLAIIGVLLIPMIADQLLLLAQKMPTYIGHINNAFRESVQKLLTQLDPKILEKVDEVLGTVSGQALSILATALESVWKSGVAILNLVSLVLISPIVAFYFLRDWDRIVSRVDSLIPRSSIQKVRMIAHDIDRTIAAFMRGQLTVMLLLAVFYASGLALVGLDFALIIGLSTGVLVLIPYIGMVVGMVTGLSVAYFQFGDAMHMGAVAGVFLLGQFIEGNFVTPKLMGDRVGLHPVWLIFGMLAGASLFGFVGILLAVPVTAVIGVLVRYGLAEYKNSDAYRGTSTGRRIAGTKKKKK